jgi:adenylosuccinate synthase
LRDPNLRLAGQITDLKDYITTVNEEIMKEHYNGKRIIIEGTQGFGLSVYHSPYYPNATSRDTTAAGFLSEVGISPFLVSDIIMVIRTFPIRVAGNSGEMKSEIDWKTVTQESNYPHLIQEYTSVTKQNRRVARFDYDIIFKALLANKPTKIALMGSDYLNYRNKGLKRFGALDKKARHFIEEFEIKCGFGINIIGTGPSDDEIFVKNEGGDEK